MRVFTGDNTGLIKESSIDTSAVVRTFGTQAKENEVLAMCFAKDESEVMPVNEREEKRGRKKRKRTRR